MGCIEGVGCAPKSEGPVDQPSTCKITTLGHSAPKSWYQVLITYEHRVTRHHLETSLSTRTHSSIFTLQI